MITVEQLPRFDELRACTRCGKSGGRLYYAGHGSTWVAVGRGLAMQRRPGMPPHVVLRCPCGEVQRMARPRPAT